MMQNKDRAKIEATAEKLIKKERYEEAIVEYQKLLSGDEKDVQVWNIIGDLFVKANKKEKAVGEFKKIAAHFEEKGIFTKAIAIYKRISRLVPDDLKILRKLADLYCDRGFVSEAKVEYSNLAGKLTKKNEPKDAIEIHKILLKLDSDNVESRLNLAELYIKEDQIDQAVEELNEAAEFKIRINILKEAGEILKKAKSLNKDHPRTLENLIDLLKLEKKKKEALKLVNEVLRKDKENLKALYLLGNLCFEDSELKKAEEIFKKIISIQPKEVEARIRLGRIHIRSKKYDLALELYQPLVDTLVKKHKEDKAIGLIGLILTAKKNHLPSLEKLASIYQENNQKKSYEIVARRLMKEYQKKKMEDKIAALEEEFPGFRPEEEKVKPMAVEAPSEIVEPEVSEPKIVEAKPKIVEAEPEIVEAEPEIVEAEPEIVEAEPEIVEAELEIVEPEPAISDAAEEAPDDFIATNLEKADQFIHQGLVRNAKRILEDLKVKFPDDPQISEKIKDLGAITSQVEEEEIVEQVEKIAEKDSELFEGGEKLTSAEIFADTDIVPLVSQETGEKRYFDLSQQLEEELEAIKHIFYQQTRGDTTVVEKELSSIVSDFKAKVDEKIGAADLEARYNLGIAYLEQDLIDDAIKEFMLAAQDEKWEMESFTNLGECHKRKNDFSEAIKWYEKALKLVGEESIQAYVLKYEIASLYEAIKESDKALLLFGEVLEWNSEYGDVSTRIKSIEKQVSK
ncbi:MAG: tetratricopeptide repeat protein [Candidatus Aminicenantes bacterium]|nr:MAG: tetratricopeptide repeat protein [Candidatus Aminicenantes bacterium]